MHSRPADLRGVEYPIVFPHKCFDYTIHHEGLVPTRLHTNKPKHIKMYGLNTPNLDTGVLHHGQT